MENQKENIRIFVPTCFTEIYDTPERYRQLKAFTDECQEILTLRKAYELIGKRIHAHHYGYAGQDGIYDFIVGGVMTWLDGEPKYDIPYKDVINKKYGDRYYIYSIEKHETFFFLVDACGDFVEPTFCCSDSDREVKFHEVED